jgi:hypothetical protein
MREHQSRQSPHPRKQFIKDLIEFINEKRSVDHDIMLNLDKGSRSLCESVDLSISSTSWAWDLKDSYRIPTDEEPVVILTSCWVQQE